MTLDVAVRGGTVVTGRGTGRADIGIRGGTVTEIGEVGPAAETIDAAGLLVLPGAVDEHVHPIYRDDPRTTSIVAAHGGVTTTLSFAYAHAGESLLDAVRDLRRRCEEGSLLDFALHATMFDAPAQMREMPAVAATGVRSFKVFLAYAAQGWMSDDASLARAMRAARDLGGLLMVHCENGPAIDLLEQDARAGRLGDDPVAALLATRPDALEAEAVARTLALAEVFGAPVLIVHVTSRRALEAVRAARARGQAFVAETCPQYLALTADALRTRGALAKIGPFLRTPDDADALWEALADGALQTVGSDHVTKKHAGDADQPLLDAGFGAPSIETMVPVLFDGAARGRISLERMVQVVCEHPARAFGLYPRKGAIAVGGDADLVLWDPDARRTLGMGVEHTSAGYSLYEGREVIGVPRRTIVGGTTVVLDGELVDDRRRGRFLPTGPFDLLG